MRPFHERTKEDLIEELTALRARVKYYETIETEREQLENQCETALETLRESEERKSFLIASMNDLIFVLDRHLIFHEYHQPMSSQLYFEPRHFIGKRFDEIGVDRLYIFMITPDRTAVDNTHEWCASGIEPQIANLQGIPGLDPHPRQGQR